MVVTPAKNISGEWKYADTVSGPLSGWNPMRWSKNMSLSALAKDVYQSSQSNRPILIRFYNSGGTLLLEKTYNNDVMARDACNAIIQQGLDKTTKDTWDHWNLTGAEGHLTNGLKYVPIVGHAVNLTHYASGKREVADEGDLRVSNTTSYVPVLGHVQAAGTYLKNGEYNELAQKSLTRSTGVTAGAAVGWAAAPAATATMGWWLTQAALAGGASAAAGNVTQRECEKRWVDPKNYEKADKGIDEFFSEVKWGVLTGVLCEVGFAGFNSAKTSVGAALTREAVEEVGEQSIRIAFKEGSSEVLGQAMQQAAAEGASEAGLRNIIDNCFVKAGVTSGFMDTDEYRLLKDKAVESYFSN